MFVDQCCQHCREVCRCWSEDCQVTPSLARPPHEDHPLPSDGANTLVQYEAGVTFGSRGPMKLWKIPLPRVGVGYVFGHDLAALRIVFGAPALSLRP